MNVHDHESATHTTLEGSLSPGTSAKHHNTHPLSVIGWNTVYFDFEVLVVPFVSVCDLGA